MNVGAFFSAVPAAGCASLAQSPTEHLFDPDAFVHVGVPAVLEDLEPVLAAPLGQVHGGVGVLEDLLGGHRARATAGPRVA